MKNYELYLVNLYEKGFQFAMKIYPYELIFHAKHFILFFAKIRSCQIFRNCIYSTYD